MKRKIIVLDTTLRDGEQVPGAKLNLGEKLEIARQLKRLNVDIIEAGFSASSPGDFQAVQEISKELGDGPVITALARAVKTDIDAVYESIKNASRPLIHIVLGTSSIHVKDKLRKSEDAVLQMGIDAVKYAKSLLPDVQYSTEDASRSDFEYLWKTIEAVVKAGATMINVPDTVGYAVPEEFGELIGKINYRLKNLDDNVILSVHCHNDMGLATPNTLAAVKNGAGKVECTMNGIGERAGNAALEEIVMGLKVRPGYYMADTNINTREIKRTSELVSSVMGLDVQVNKAITGDNAFAHSSGIHQDGLLKARKAYEIIRPEDVGVESMDMVLTARSGKHAFKNALDKLGFRDFQEPEFTKLFDSFLEFADKRKEVYNSDLYYILKKHFDKSTPGETKPEHNIELYEIKSIQVISNDIVPTACVELLRSGNVLKSIAIGDGPIDALYTAIGKATGLDAKLKEYKVKSVSAGKEALGRATVKLEYNGKIYASRAVDVDIIKSSAIAYINAINELVIDEFNTCNPAV